MFPVSQLLLDRTRQCHCLGYKQKDRTCRIYLSGSLSRLPKGPLLEGAPPTRVKGKKGCGQSPKKPQLILKKWFQYKRKAVKLNIL